MVALLLPQLYFWPAKIWDKDAFFELPASLTPDAKMLFRHKCRKLETKVSYFFNGENSCFVKWSEFFQSLGEVSVWQFLVLQFCWNLRNWIPNFFDQKWIGYGFFFLEYAPLSQLHDCIEWYHQELFKFYFFWGYQLSRTTILRGIPICLNECACRFQPWVITISVDGPIENSAISLLFLRIPASFHGR